VGELFKVQFPSHSDRVGVDVDGFHGLRAQQSAAMLSYPNRSPHQNRPRLFVVAPEASGGKIPSRDGKAEHGFGCVPCRMPSRGPVA
jgi:hypothetical protein